MGDRTDMLSVAAAARAPYSKVGRYRGQTVIYEEWSRRVCAWRTLLNRTSGLAYALYISDSIEFAAALYGAWHAGKTIYLPADVLPDTCAGMSCMIDGYLGEFAPEWKPLAPGPDDYGSARMRFDRLPEEWVGLVLYTSGSTGTAQPIPKRLAQISTEVHALEMQFAQRLGEAEILATVSHQHIYGLLFKVLWPLTAGRVIHAKSFSFPEELASALAEHDSVLVSSPAHLKRLAETPAWGAAASRVRTIFSSGGPLPDEVAQKTRRILSHLPVEVYGSSETGGVAWRQQHAGRHQLWTCFHGVTVRVDPADGALEIRSPYLAHDQWFRTADQAEASGDHQFILKGRMDRLVKIEEKRISLSAIERHLMSSPMVTDARTLVVNGRRHRVAAFLVLSSSGRRQLAAAGKPAMNRMLRDRLRDCVDAVGLPRIWRYLDQLPINAQGKTTQAELRALLEDLARRPTSPVQHLIEKEAQRVVLEILVPRDLVYFDGHFEGMPILAGVVQLDWAIACGRRHFELPPLFRSVQALKFQRVISPGLPITLELIHEAEKSSLSFNINSRLGCHSRGRIIFGAAGV